MDTDMSFNMVKTLQEENKQLKLEVGELKEKLEKYTNSEGHKKYYEKIKTLLKRKQRII